MSLDDDLRTAVRNGFVHVSLGKLWDGDLWQCSYRTASSTVVHNTEDRDPAEAMRKAFRSGVRVEKSHNQQRREVEDLA